MVVLLYKVFAWSSTGLLALFGLVLFVDSWFRGDASPDTRSIGSFLSIIALVLAYFTNKLRRGVVVISRELSDDKKHKTLNKLVLPLCVLQGFFGLVILISVVAMFYRLLVEGLPLLG